ncbi:MAG: DUF3516 domain-containing protein [Acidobacteriota bacterium]|nr:DUF3516 domain-containing protein [Acidobacteriota bacterium]MDE2924407.1 DUF3516 domain-containing protein [Acidobacteriota bacterium]MDE3264057.1 DUF3516 domain-containing protein [Acidobacteriota bacterium]
MTGASLADRLPETPGTFSSDLTLERFLEWVSGLGFELFPAQEEALVDIMAGRHVVLDTPTGSGKSLVAMAMLWKGLCEGRTGFYTAPVKALASEQFFRMCNEFGAERVGMLTGDAAINPKAPIVCCTAEVLANMALRQGAELPVDYVVMDEFHFYADPERGVSWQVPLIALPDTTFLLMSATLGNMAPISEALERATGRPVALVSSRDRPVPLEYEYRETPLHVTIEELANAGRAPIYVVNFTQQDCARLAQSLTSLRLCSREEKKAIFQEIGDFRFDTAYGREIRRFLGFGIGVHHAGLLPKYRLLVEKLAQSGLLKVIAGTDTLGVGVNVPIRTVLFSQLCKFDGEKDTILKVRDFRQIAGRAGRKGFDELGWVVCQAPAHEIENRRRRLKARASPRGRGRRQIRKRPPRGFVPWNERTFERLVTNPPETLKSRFRLRHGMVFDLIQADESSDGGPRTNFASLRRLIAACHEPATTRDRLIGEAAELVRALHRAGIVRMAAWPGGGYVVEADRELQIEFSMHQNLSLYLLATLELLDRQDADYALNLLSLVEAILEDPGIVLRRQAARLRDELAARLKAKRVPFEERMERLRQVTHPRPLLDLIEPTFDVFRRSHPWVRGDSIRPKRVGREVYEDSLSFDDFIRRYDLQRSEGVVLRYLSRLFKVLSRGVPDRFKTDAVFDQIGYFHALLTRVDSSLLNEWERLWSLEDQAGRS